MSKRLGGIIKSVAVCFLIVELISILISGILVCIKLSAVMGIIIIIGGVLVAFFGFIVLYGLGELLDSNKKIVENIEKILAASMAINSVTDNHILKKETQKVEIEVGKDTLYEEINSLNEIECPVCFHCISKDDANCPHCGYKLK